MTPIVVLERVHARDDAGPEGRSRGAVTGLSISLGPGAHAFLGAPADGTLALLGACTGARAPLRGRVTILGRAPARTPFLRARIGTLGPVPRLPAAPTVRASVSLAMRARGESGDRFDTVLDPLGLSRLSARDPRTLSFAEQRAVELALALSTPAPALLALHEPLCDVAAPLLDALHRRLREAAASGTCVLLTTSSPADARALSDHVLVLHKGTVARETREGGALVTGEAATLEARVRSGARELAAALTLRPELRGVSWRDGSAVSISPTPPEAAPSPSTPAHPAEWATRAAAVIEVSGDRAEDCAMAIIESALAVGAEIEAMTEASPTLGQVRSTTESLWAALRKRPAPAQAHPAEEPDPAAEPAQADEPAQAEERAPAAPPAPAVETSAPVVTEEPRGEP